MKSVEKPRLIKEWDKTFPKSNKVNHRKVTFHNRYGITLAADLYEPKDYTGKLAAIAIFSFTSMLKYGNLKVI